MLKFFGMDAQNLCFCYQFQHYRQKKENVSGSLIYFDQDYVKIRKKNQDVMIHAACTYQLYKKIQFSFIQRFRVFICKLQKSYFCHHHTIFTWKLQKTKIFSLQIIQFAHVSLMKMYNFVLFETLQCTPVNRKKPEELLLKDFYSYSFQL